MDLQNPKPFHVQLIPKFVSNEEGHLRSAFKWGLISNPQILNTNLEGTLSYIFNLEEQKKLGPELISMMRLFACNTIKDLLRNEGIIDQSHIDGKVNFLNERPDIKNFLADSIEALENEILKELLYQIDPLKPTKSKLESLSLNSKQNNNQDNE